MGARTDLIIRGFFLALGIGATSSACSSDAHHGASGEDASAGNGGANTNTGGTSSGGGSSDGGGNGGAANTGGTGSGGTSSLDAGRDASAARDASGTGDDAAVDAGSGCGTGVTLKNSDVLLQPSQSNPGADVVVTSSTCKGHSTLGTTDSSGKWGTAEVASGVPFYVKSAGGAYYTGLTPEYDYPAGTSISKFDAQLFSNAFSQYYPDHDGTHAEIEVHIGPGQAAPCTGVPSGYVLTVPDHPEAHVTYWGNSGLNSQATSTVNGIVYVSQITPGTPVALSATNGACTVNFGLLGQTGRAPIEAGAITYIAGTPQGS